MLPNETRTPAQRRSLYRSLRQLGLTPGQARQVRDWRICSIWRRLPVLQRIGGDPNTAKLEREARRFRARWARILTPRGY